MSDRVYKLIETLKEKTLLLKGECALERSKNNELTAKNQALSTELAEKSITIESLKEQINELMQKHSEVKEQNVGQAEEGGISDEQIDELVKEIEYCIGQLKK
jgi:uncharacterized coiled-coil protein SlyX